MTTFSPEQLAALVVAVSFAAGLNVYAAVATLGLLARFNVVDLPASLDVLSNWWVLGASAALFVVEFFADKVPAFDLVWNALQTFVRVPVASLLAWQASQTLSPTSQLIAAAAGGVIALAAHSGKFAVRGLVTPSPEPLSNIALSLTEDAAAIGLTWFATQHPYVAAGVALTLVAIIVVLIRWVVRALAALFRGAERQAHLSTGPSPH
jgi:Domain of unknown function (DUF4126)